MQDKGFGVCGVGCRIRDLGCGGRGVMGDGGAFVCVGGEVL